MRGTSGIAIGEVADMVREIMVRNVVLGNCGSPGGLAPPRLGGTPRPTTGSRCGGRGATAGRPAIPARSVIAPYHSAATSAASSAVGRATMTGGFLSHSEGNYEPERGDF